VSATKKLETTTKSLSIALLSLAIAACATTPPPDGATYTQLALMIDSDQKGHPLLVVGVAEMVGADKIRIGGSVMQLTQCELKASKSRIAPAGQVAIFDAMDGMYFKGPKRVSLELSQMLDQLVAAQKIQLSNSELLCAKQVLDATANSEDSI
jgi:hypothetical protein